MSREKLLQLLTKNIPEIEGKELWIWGTGGTACLYQEGLNRVALGKQIVGYCDNNEKKWGDVFGGKPVISPKELKDHPDACALICSLQPRINAEIMTELKQLGITGYLIDEVILKVYYEEVLKCYDLLGDDVSRDIYAELIVSRMQGKYPDGSIYTDNNYFIFPQLSKREVGATFVDCGAYVGDTIERYIWHVDGVVTQIIGIEPDADNYRALTQRKKRLCTEWNIQDERIQVINAGVGEKTETRKLVNINSGLGSQFADCKEEGIQQNIVALDDILAEPYSFLKADIESFEYKMLLGAQTGIKKWKPDIAVCIYHNAVDLFSVAQLIHNLVPEYKMAIRHHSYSLLETVLYAWTE